jgi:hypothetical protein
MTSRRKHWEVGDNVSVVLPDKSRRRGQGYAHVNAPGVVVAVDPKGVHVRLMITVNGLDTCYATHDELEPRP